ncbi:DnaJ-related protein rsp1 [Colletotrichum gloeosporioides]|uniref:DnaJ-related protein rsp1 n=1 Tax=Colletotrichum gloeosporioides TaxID=474922 RepID=A0A8H4CXJ4_COLGL|nr:DnaJ-related protein rsp1 [Colletotrichum gloeosporioides]KAF3811647.1 DnaJ-related protein rsp1 [Colletotrichum gloeosporioides]
MGGVDMSRDYYADLELPANSDVNEIKKQFRKLALKYHPDRNPGREAEVNSKFQMIQSAHEVLTDPDSRAKYDAGRTRSRYPTASGVRGNPWQNAGSNFPPPPRRNATSTARNPPSSGANRYRNFASGAAPTAKAQQQSDPEAKRNAWHAFENMRGKASQSQPKPKNEPPEPPKRPVPRTPSQKQRAEAAFGARKGGYVPHSPVPGDEPPVNASNYSTTNRHSNIFADNARRQGVPDPLAQFREGYADSRQSTPYSSHGGEKTNPFDGVPIGRAKSTRETPRQPEEAFGPNLSPGSARQRAQSVPRQARTEPSSPRTSSTPQDDRPNTATATAANSPKDPFRSRASARYTPPNANPGFAQDGGHPKPATATDEHGNTKSAGKQQASSMYGTSHYSTSSFASYVKPTFTYGKQPSPVIWEEPTKQHQSQKSETSSSASSSPSGDSLRSHSLTPFERKQGELLSRLVKRQAPELTPLGREKRQITTSKQNPSPVHQADRSDSTSFNFSIDDDTFTRTEPEQPSISRRSTDDINTRFVNNDGSEAYQFSAGSPVHDAKGRSQSGSRVGRRSPIKRPTLRHQKDFAGQPTGSPSSEGKFDAQDWTQQIGAQNFAPSVSTSPTRTTRSNSRKAKVKPTAGSAGLVNDEYDSDEDGDWRGRKTTAEPVGAKSPNAMDIDPPQAGGAPNVAQSNGARNIPVEPSRPEWRPGNVNGVTETAPKSTVRKPDFNPNAAGSEDSEEFRASFADLKNVAPFAQTASGLGSLGDLKMNLPFESQPSSSIPIEKEKKPALEFPVVPVAPRPPPTFAVGLKPTGGAWQKYIQDFQSYVLRWEIFNAQVIEHFNARKTNIADLRARKGYDFIASRGDDELMEYLDWMQQDKEVRRKWALACEDHEARIREFMLYKSKMK